MTHDELMQQYEKSLETLRGLAALRDWSPDGDKAFYLARENVYWCKCAVVLWESKNHE